MSTNGWTMRWGEGNPERWLETRLKLTRGEYTMSDTGGHLTLDDPKEPRTRALDLYWLRESFGRDFAVAMTELSNGIWAVGYKDGRP